MTICRRCHGDFDKDDDEYAEGVHWVCLTYDEQMQISRRERCKHKKPTELKSVKTVERG